MTSWSPIGVSGGGGCGNIRPFILDIKMNDVGGADLVSGRRRPGLAEAANVVPRRSDVG